MQRCPEQYQRMVRSRARLAANGLDARAQVVGNGYEGVVAKDEASVYEGPGEQPGG